jgi:hypothetical protein
LFTSAAGEDKALAADSEFRAGITKVLKTCFIGHVRGYARDIGHYVRPWKTTLAEVSVNTHLWHGAEDNWSPPLMAEYLKSAIPDCTSTKIFSGLSHYQGYLIKKPAPKYLLRQNHPSQPLYAYV